MVAVNLAFDRFYMIVHWKISWRILLTEQRSGRDPPNLSERGLNSACNSPFTAARNIILSKCQPVSWVAFHWYYKHCYHDRYCFTLL